jgi:hypothetical protein
MSFCCHYQLIAAPRASSRNYQGSHPWGHGRPVQGSSICISRYRSLLQYSCRNVDVLLRVANIKKCLTLLFMIFSILVFFIALRLNAVATQILREQFEIFEFCKSQRGALLCTGSGSATWYTTHVCSTVSIYNFSLWSIVVVLTLGKCAHRQPAGIRERHTYTGLI